MDTELIDRIYECSLVPELWPGLLDELGRIAEADRDGLFIAKAGLQYWAAPPKTHELTERLVNEGWFWRGQIMARAFALRHAGFLTLHDLFTPDELDREPLYRDFWRPQGIGWAAATTIPIPTGENVCFGFMRLNERGPFERAVVDRLDELRPHLARSALLSARLQLQQARMAGETLAALGLPALVLNENGKVLAANSLIESLSEYVRWRAQDQVALKDKAADQLLHDAVAAIDAAGGAVRSFPVRGAGAEAMMVAHIVPIRLSARDIFIRCAAALILTPVTAPQAPPVELVQSLFDLTPAEARVARGLAGGETVEAIANSRGVSQNTIRMQVRGVLEKTGCNRQADIIALLTAISPARLTHPA